MKKVVLVLSSAVLLACGVAVPVASGSTSGPAVTVQVKTLTKTLLRPTVAHAEKGWITKGGTPKGKCSGNSAAGALDAATHGRWTGKYFASVGGIFLTSIEGVKPSGSDYWGFFVNGKSSSVGICETRLHGGQRLLFKIVK